MSKSLENKSSAVYVLPQSTKPSMYDNPRQIVYSYFDKKELIKVASLSKRERETVLNSKIVRENRKESTNTYSFYTSKLEKYSTEVAVKGLLITI